MTTKRRGMTEEAANAAIDQACRMLRMPTIRNSFTDYADRAGHEQMGLAGAGVPDEAEWLALLDPFALGEGVDHGGVDVGVGVEVKGSQGLLAGELGGLDSALGPASGAVVAFGEQ